MKNFKDQSFDSYDPKVIASMIITTHCNAMYFHNAGQSFVQEKDVNETNYAIIMGVSNIKRSRQYEEEKKQFW